MKCRSQLLGNRNPTTKHRDSDFGCRAEAWRFDNPTFPRGTPDEARERVAELWETADSMTLMPPRFSELDMGKFAFYQKAIADTFYLS